MAFSGWAPDARQLVAQGRSEVHSYDETYGSVIPTEVLAERMAQYVHYFTIHGALRPFGVGAILAGYDPETKLHSLHMIEPNGVQYRYFGCALGKVRVGRAAAVCRTHLLSKGRTRIQEYLSYLLLLLSGAHGRQDGDRENGPVDSHLPRSAESSC